MQQELQHWDLQQAAQLQREVEARLRVLLHFSLHHLLPGLPAHPPCFPNVPLCNAHLLNWETGTQAFFFPKF